MAKVAAAGLYFMLGLALVGCTHAFSLGRCMLAPRHIIKAGTASVVSEALRIQSARRLQQRGSTAIMGIGNAASSSNATSTVPAFQRSIVHKLTTWLTTKDPVAALDECMIVEFFDGNLRGIKWSCPVPSQDEVRVVASIPAKKVLRSSFPSPTWDSQLAMMLLEEHRKGPASLFYPYIDFLTSGQPFSADSCPAPLAPHAVRHWSNEQLAALDKSIAGRRLLALRAEQDALWRTKYETLRKQALLEVPTWEQFCWAMEAVHSRAYLGASVESSSAASLTVATAPTAIAAVIGLFYAADLEVTVPPLFLWSGLVVIATVPLISALLRPPPKSAVMLPIIDVVNHNSDADSSIRFDPLSNAFELVANLRRCVDKSDGQLFVSYGNKSDIELLLNHGFIPRNDASLRSHSRGLFEVADGCIVFCAEDDQIRNELASRFSSRNSDESVAS